MNRLLALLLMVTLSVGARAEEASAVCNQVTKAFYNVTNVTDILVCWLC